MFALRTIEQNGVQKNQAIGESYEVITKLSSPEIFNRLMEEVEGAGLLKPYTYGFISIADKNAHGWKCLLKDDQYYIMTESGKTFSNLTYHGYRRKPKKEAVETITVTNLGNQKN